MAQKKITDLQLRTDVDTSCNFPVDDATQTWRVSSDMIRKFVIPDTAGDGIFLRRPDGTLREIAIDNDDNLIVLSV